MQRKILIRYSEIALKGKNRHFFEQALSRNLKQAVKNTGTQIVRLHGRFLAVAPEGKTAAVMEKLQKVFGVVSLSEVFRPPGICRYQGNSGSRCGVAAPQPEYL